MVAAKASVSSNMPPNRRVGVATLGCKVNSFESQLISQKLNASNWRVVDEKEFADVYIINTCTVTREADRQARQAVRRAVRRNPAAFVVVTGCYAQISPGACAAIPGVGLVLGNDRKLEVDKYLLELFQKPARQGGPQVLVGDLDEHVSLPSTLLTGYDGHTRAFVQVQQGCNQGCTFCVIHRARGPSRSLMPTIVKRQVLGLVMSGYKEIVVCGVDLGSYGQDLRAVDSGAYNLTGLLRELCAIENDFRIRLSSIDPAHIDAELIEFMATQRKMCPHLHLSLQSGNTLILKRMKRRYTAEQAIRTTQDLRRRIPNMVLSADILVGFPTETEAQFMDTLRIVDRLGIAYPHVFPFSERSGTPAANIPSSRQIPVAQRKARAGRVRVAGKVVLDRLLQSRLGSTERVLVEGGECPVAGYQKGRAADYTEVWLPVSAQNPGQWAQVTFESVRGNALIAGVPG